MAKKGILFLLLSIVFLPVGPVLAERIALTIPSVRWLQHTFWFRDDDGTELSATGYGSGNILPNTSIAGVGGGTPFRLRFGIKALITSGIITPRLEFKQGTDCVGGTWTAITTTGDNFVLRASPNFNDGDATTQQITSGGFSAGRISEISNPAVSANVPQNFFTEYEWSIKAADGIASNTQFAFRVSNNGAALTGYNQCPVVTTAYSGGVSAPAAGEVDRTKNTLLRFYGKAYPGAEIFLIEKALLAEGLFTETGQASENGDFVITKSGIRSGNYAYSLIIKDKEGRQTQTKVYQTDATNLLDKYIFTPPTLGLIHTIVKPGDYVYIVGYATPKNNVIIEVGDKLNFRTVSGADGSFSLKINTEVLSLGRYAVRARQQDDVTKEESDFSLVKNFVISDVKSVSADLNADGALNISDWSIFLAKWKSVSQEEKKILDLNGDGGVDILDLSVFLKAFKQKP